MTGRRARRSFRSGPTRRATTGGTAAGRTRGAATGRATTGGTAAGGATARRTATGRTAARRFRARRVARDQAGNAFSDHLEGTRQGIPEGGHAGHQGQSDGDDEQDVLSGILSPLVAS